MGLLSSCYICRDCGQEFTPLHKDGSVCIDEFGADEPTCPKCGSTKLGLKTFMG